MLIHQSKGMKLTDNVTRSGKRYEKSKEDRRGGAREKKEWVDMKLHEHAKQGRGLKLENSRERFEGFMGGAAGDE